MPAHVLLIGLDGATFDLIEPWVREGLLPHLARLMSEGAWARLGSTVPPATIPAWTSLVTGVGPGKHGLFDFTRRVPGTYRIEFTNATYRRCPSIWRLLSQAGRRVAVIGFPGSYPPEAVNGVLISGFDSPVATGIGWSFASPPEIYEDIRRAVGRYELAGIQEVRIAPGWHGRALPRLLHAIRRRIAIAAYLLRREPWDCFAVHFGESDTVAHHFWAFHDPNSPRFDAPGATRWGDAIRTVYQALDEAVGTLIDGAGSGSTVLVVSDHGSGGTGDRVIHLNRWLAQQGWLRFKPPGRAGRTAARLKRLGLALPAALQEQVFRGPLRPLAGRLESGARLGGVDWAGTAAFSEEVNTFPSIWLNLRGREPEGTVVPGAGSERLRDELVARLLDWRNPETGRPVIRRVWRRETLYHGPASDEAPDLVLEPAPDGTYAYTFLSSGGRPGEAIRHLAPAEQLGFKGGSMNGSHRPEGVLILAGKGVRPGSHPVGAEIVDIAPTLLALLGVALPDHLDGHVLSAALAAAEPTGAIPGAEALDPAPAPYTNREAAAVHRQLRGLGYQT